MGGNGSGRGGVSLAKVRRAERLLGEGRSQRDVARLVGVDVATVHRIAHGTHFLQRSLDEARYQRCGCGALTDVQPCLACQLRRAGL